MSIFVAATGQNVGKTTLCLGLLSALGKRFDSVGFIKPVGQRHVQTHDGVMVDKDVVLFKEQFGLTDRYEEMSPVLFPKGYTRDFLEGKVDLDRLWERIEKAYAKISSQHSFTLVEGTGHVGVGSICQINNAMVAKRLGLDVVIIASAGLGSALDELALNFTMCQHYGVNVRGVILNRVKDEKREMIEEYFPKALEAWNIPLLGCVPFSKLLSTPCMNDFCNLFNTELLSGDPHRLRHFTHTRLVAGSLESFQEELIPNELIITPASREDIVMATLERHLRAKVHDETDFEGGMILTGRWPPREFILNYIKEADLPILYAPVCSYDAMKMITSFIAKIRRDDSQKVNRAIGIVEDHVDLDSLLKVGAS